MKTKKYHFVPTTPPAHYMIVYDPLPNVVTIANMQMNGLDPNKMSLFLNQIFMSHSGLILPFKIECDDLTPRDLECLSEIVAKKFQYQTAIGIPRGGLKFAHYLNKYSTPGHLTLIVDDVYTTGKSMQEFAQRYKDIPHIGVVIFARTQPPTWIHSIFNFNTEYDHK